MLFYSINLGYNWLLFVQQNFECSCLYSWVWFGSKLLLWCSAVCPVLLVPSGDQGCSGRRQCGCTSSHFQHRCCWRLVQDPHSWWLRTRQYSNIAKESVRLRSILLLCFCSSRKIEHLLISEQLSIKPVLPTQSGGCPVHVPLVVQCLVVRPDVLNPSQHA